MYAEAWGYTAAEALAYLCASRSGRSRLSRILIGVTVVAAAAVGLGQLLGL
jgi:ABC-type protease/lipase transport system fused ATPase/permease subunit